jgi:peptide/nickel transport system substrate-binding protein
MVTSRRDLLGAGLISMLPAAGYAAETPVRGGQLIIGQYTDPPMLTGALTTAGASQFVSGKIFDGLLTYDLNMTPRPRLAVAWSNSPDGRSLAFRLRPGVSWHDGKPFTSADVAFSVLEVWRKYHSRGRSTFANVVAVDTPDPLTAILRLSKPAPYILSALSALESQVVPKHIYAGTDILTNRANIAPIGTGPFRFVEWKRDEYIALERNPNYWDKGKPYLDRVIFRILPNPDAHATALETGEIHLTEDVVPIHEIARLTTSGRILLDSTDYPCISRSSGLEFNLDRPALADVRVRQAIAHAIDREFIIRNIWQGYAKPAISPIPGNQISFFTPDVPLYPYDLKKAAALLDQAGLKPGQDGVRLTVNLDPTPGGAQETRIGEYIRNALGNIGIRANLRNQDFASFVRRIYTNRDFDLNISGGQMGPDPVIGTQRFYWSKNFQRGIAFSNGAHYDSPAADSALERAQSETDPIKRRADYVEFQRIAQTDLPRIPLISPLPLALYVRNLHRLATGAEGTWGNFAEAYFQPD